VQARANGFSTKQFAHAPLLHVSLHIEQQMVSRTMSYRGTSLTRPPPPWEPTVALCLGTYGDPRGGGCFLLARYPGRADADCTAVSLTRSAEISITSGAFPTGPPLSAKKRSYPHTGSACIYPTRKERAPDVDQRRPTPEWRKGLVHLKEMVQNVNF